MCTYHGGAMASGRRTRTQRAASPQPHREAQELRPVHQPQHHPDGDGEQEVAEVDDGAAISSRAARQSAAAAPHWDHGRGKGPARYPPSTDLGPGTELRRDPRQRLITQEQPDERQPVPQKSEKPPRSRGTGPGSAAGIRRHQDPPPIMIPDTGPDTPPTPPPAVLADGPAGSRGKSGHSKTSSCSHRGNGVFDQRQKVSRYYQRPVLCLGRSRERAPPGPRRTCRVGRADADQIRSRARVTLAPGGPVIRRAAG